MSGVIGKPRRRVDGRAKVTGQTRFADDIAAAAHGALQAAPLAGAARAHRPHRHLARGGASRRPAGPDGRSVSDSVRRPAGQPRRARALPGQGALRRRSRGGRHRPRRGHRRRGRHADRRRLRAAAHVRVSPPTASRTPSRASTTTATRATSTRPCRSQFGDIDAAIAGADHVFDDVFFFEGKHAPADRAARGDRGEGSRRQARGLVQHADAALPASRAGQGARDAGGAHPRRSPRPTAAASAARAIRSTTKSSSRRRRCCSIGR